MRIVAITCVKNEGPFLLEWIAFNRVIGVTDHLFYSNDCTDGTDLLLDALAAAGVVLHLPNPARTRNYQMEALRHARQQPVVREVDWVWVADVDEFPCIHVGDGTFPDLIAACGNPAAISLHWQFMANGGVDAFVDQPVIGQFDRTHNPDIWADQFQIETKSLYRRDFPVHFMGAHRPYLRPSLPEAKAPRWSDASGRPVPRRYHLAPAKAPVRGFSARGAREFATLNHYALRSLDSYLVKNDRGDVNRENRTFDTAYWRNRNDDMISDTRIRKYLPRLKAETERLKALPGVGALHDLACTRHRETLARLMADPVYVALREELRGASTLPPAELALLDLLA